MENSMQDLDSLSLFPQVLTKSQRTKLRIIDSTIEQIATRGIDRTSYQQIADGCKVTRQLVKHYFPERNLLLRQVMMFVLKNLESTIKERLKDVAAENTLENYVLGYFDWVERYPKHAKVWLLSFYYGAIHSTVTEDLDYWNNDLLREVIENQPGQINQVHAIKTIHSILIWGIVRRLTQQAAGDENHDASSIAKEVVDTCQAVVAS